MKMKNFKPVLVLSAICVAVALLLGLVNLATKDKIEGDQIRAIEEARTAVLDASGEPKEIKPLPAGTNSSVKALYELVGVGYIVEVEGKGYADTIKLTVGVIDGAVNKVIVTYQNETHGKSLSSLYDSFIDLEKGDIDGVEKVTGASISSSAVKNLVKQALDCAIKAASGPVDETKGIYYNDAKNIISDAELTKDELKDAPGGIIEAYSTADGRKVIVAKGNGYASEITLAVGVNTDGKIIKLVIVDQAETHGKDMAGFYDSFAGVDSGAIDSIEKVTEATRTSDFIKAIVKNAVAYALGQEPEVPKEEQKPEIELLSEEELQEKILALVGSAGEKLDLIDPPDVLKALYKVDGGYVAYTITSTQYVAKETEGLTFLDANGKVIKSNLVTWTVGHGVEPGNFANGFEGLENGNIGSVELVTGATGTAEHYRDAVKAASDYVILTGKIPSLVKEFTGLDPIRISLTAAPETLKALYKVAGGYVAYTVTSTQYVAVETEGLTWFDNYGNVIKSNLITWVVGGNAPGPDDLADRFTGKENGEIGSVEHVTGATGTSEHYRDAIKAAADYVLSIFDNKINQAGNSILGSGALQINSSTSEDILAAFTKDGDRLIVIKGTYYADEDADGKDIIIAVRTDVDGKILSIDLILGDEINVDDIDSVLNSFVNATLENIDSIDNTTAISNVVKNLAKAAIEFAICEETKNDIELRTPVSDEKIEQIIKQLYGDDAQKIELVNAPKTLKLLYKVGDFYVAYTVTSTNYNPVETQVITCFDQNGRVIKSNLITWRVGHGTVPGNLADSFADKHYGAIGYVDIVSGSTGTSTNYRDAVKAVSNYVLSISDKRITDAIQNIFGDGCGFEAIDFKGAKFVSRIFKTCGGYAVLVELETPNGDRGVEAVVGIKDGKIIGVKLVNNFVDGFEGELTSDEMQEYLNSFVGKNIDEVAKAEVKGDSDTAKRIKRAVKASLRNLDKYLTEKADAEKAALYGKIDNVIGFILVAIALPAVPVIVIVTSKKEKRRDE